MSYCDKCKKAPVSAECVLYGCKFEPLKKMTNADRIRAMNDEELAELLCGTFVLGRHSKLPFINNLAWLQSEVKESEE